MRTTRRILRSALLLSVALTSGFTTAALAGVHPAPVVHLPVAGMKQPVGSPSRRPPGQGGIIGGGGASGALCYEKAPGCHQPY